MSDVVATNQAGGVPLHVDATNRGSPQREGRGTEWSWKLVRVVGMDVYVHGSFILLAALVFFGEFASAPPVAAILRSASLLLAVFTAVLLHEIGHALVARRYGMRTWHTTLFPIGGVARRDRGQDRLSHPIVVALAGPAVNLAIALGLFGLLQLLGGPVGVETVRRAGGPLMTQLMWINGALAVFNLFPGFPMDGGRILEALLARYTSAARAAQLAARFGLIAAVSLGVAGLFTSPFLTVIAVFVWLGARAEHSIALDRIALEGLSSIQSKEVPHERPTPLGP
jgi:Zn-dependent protease